MTRIIGGAARGRSLVVPSRGTRPTSDRVREALFSSAATDVELVGARVLDLYSGSGAVGLEALSRGAAHVLLVERDRRACAALRRNVDALGLPGAVVRCEPVAAVLAVPPSEGYEMAFLDPPYDMPAALLDIDVATLVARGWIRPGGLVVVERARRSDPLSWPPGLVVSRERRYGDTTLCYATR